MLRPWKLELEIDKKLDKAVYLQIADTIITDIRSGRLKAGDALPGSRNLAVTLKINRNTVVEAYQVLINEEWVISRERKGIFVSERLPVLQEKNINGLHNSHNGVSRRNGKYSTLSVTSIKQSFLIY